MLIRPARKDEWLRVADVFIAARAGMAYLPQLHSDEETRAFIRGVVETGVVWVAEGGGCVAGFAATERTRDGAWLHHLYVHPREHNAGAGSLLLARVKMELPEGFSLWTFQANLGARRFYERHGCREIRRTAGENEENLPDILYEWRP
ncbi:GNAT family N-acetyltransferase [Parvibaculum sp.]|uniref:GNAT family N-acetyltransferase n=1 Tax=Parvibaculum sp. TaxID=2024848 RepID=UPI002722C41B|nr:GNAT family N-acetyltransferase [Parvibaculum sp.]MDO9126580.1 GNAT family N-acetyltransferase [Parvibaculum sp.]MDP1625896.1 GNAT family N-acetyltransferase [Parvibaculum sp.]MDP2149600.1 GNAT family N-acetyltransferase [Parvibaculum sp.]MDP3329323.1 GNAT family N-acetyltransferase [Parvibaculum sp.]